MFARSESAAGGMGLTTVGTLYGTQVLAPVRQAVERRVRADWHRENLTPINPNMFNNNSIQCKFRVPTGSLTRVHHVVLRVDCKVSNAAVQPLPIQYWFNEINVKLSNDTSLMRQYPDTAFFNSIYALRDSQLKSMLSEMNCNFTDDSMFDTMFPLQPGSYTFHLPLLGSWLTQGVWMKEMAGSELTFEFTPAPSIMATGLDSNFQCTGMSLIFETEAIEEKEQAAISFELSNKTVNYNFLDPQLVFEPAKTLTSGQTHEFDLSPLVGKKYAFFLLSILPAGTTYANDNFRKWRTLGFDGTLDIAKSGTPIWSRGAPFNVKHLRNEIFVHHCNNSFGNHRSLYLIPLSQSVAASMSGSGEAGMLAVNDQFKLRITPGTASVPEIHRFTQTAVPTDGFFRVEFNMSKSDPLPYNATTQQIEAAINALEDFKSQGFTATVDAKFSDGLVVNATIQNPCQDLIDDRLQIVDCSFRDNNGAAIAVTSSCPQPTNGGFANSGGSFDIRLYAYRFSTLQLLGTGVKRIDSDI